MKKIVIIESSSDKLHIIRDKNMMHNIEMRLNGLNKDSIIVGKDQNGHIIIAEKAEIEDV